MDSSSVVLMSERSERSSRHLGARLTEKGDLIIEGQDLGTGVERFWGDGLSEYEWTIIVRAAHVPQLFPALAGTRGEDILSLLKARYSEDKRYASKTFLDGCAIPNEFWNRVGK